MRFYNKAHAYYCGIDLHARWMYLCVLDQARCGPRFWLTSWPVPSLSSCEGRKPLT